MRVANTDPVTGKTTYSELSQDHPLRQEWVHLEMTPSKETLIADGNDEVVLMCQLLDGFNQAIQKSVTVVLRVEDTHYKLELDRGGQASVQLRAIVAGQIVVHVVEPTGGLVSIVAYKPEPSAKDLTDLPIHSGPILVGKQE